MQTTIVTFRRANGRQCYCAIADLAAVREAMGLNQSEFARLLFISRPTLYRYEHPPEGRHLCLPKPCLGLLFAWMHTEPYTQRLISAGFPIPAEPPLDWFPKRSA